MATLPTLSNGTLCVYPLEESISYQTKIIRLGGQKQQRFCQSRRRKRWTLQYRGIKWADVQTLEAFFAEVKGRQDTTWMATIAGVTYPNLMLDSDEFTVRETGQGRFTASLSFSTPGGY